MMTEQRTFHPQIIIMFIYIFQQNGLEVSTRHRYVGL